MNTVRFVWWFVVDHVFDFILWLADVFHLWDDDHPDDLGF